MDVNKWRRHTYMNIHHTSMCIHTYKNKILTRNRIIYTVISTYFNSRGKIPSAVEDVANDHTIFQKETSAIANK